MCLWAGQLLVIVAFNLGTRGFAWGVCACSGIALLYPPHEER